MLFFEDRRKIKGWRCQRSTRKIFQRDDICIFLYHRTGEINAHTSNPLRSEWGIKYPSQARKACDIIFVADRQLEALSLCELHRGIVFRPFFIDPRIFQRSPIAQKIEGRSYSFCSQNHILLWVWVERKVTYLLAFRYSCVVFLYFTKSISDCKEITFFYFQSIIICLSKA